MKRIGQIIRERRESKGLLLKQVSITLPIDIAVLSKIERGERNPTRDQLCKLADFLDLDKDQLIIKYMSEKIAHTIADETLGLQILRASEKLYKRTKTV
ncbi:MAG: helix-turn-helix domain-containing protein [Ginsengibacter sp.]